MSPDDPSASAPELSKQATAPYSPGMEGDDLDRARKGDRAAFGRLVRLHQRRVYGAILHILGNHHDADDVAQETFVRAYRGLGTYDGRAELSTWLYRIAINTALNHLRSQKRVAAVAQAGADAAAHEGGRPEHLGVAERTPHEWAEIGEELKRVLEEVAALSTPLRVTLVLATVEQLPYKQIAEVLDVPEGTVAWRVNEARRLLRERLSQAAPDSPPTKSDRQRR
jgi:RNA polymerase sigma-70 factor (ECF subfamily)